MLHNKGTLVPYGCLTRLIFSKCKVPPRRAHEGQEGEQRYNFILIRSNKMQQMQVIYYCKLTLHVSGVYRPPSSGEHPTVTTASGTGHSIRATTFCKLGLISHAGRRSLPWYVIWPVPEAVVTVWCAPDDGVNGCPKYVEQFCSNKYLHMLHLVGSYEYRITMHRTLNIKSTVWRILAWRAHKYQEEIGFSLHWSNSKLYSSRRFWY